jgi:hypothetical protein
MDFSVVLEVLEDEKRRIVSEKRKIRRDRANFGVFDTIVRKMTGDMTYEEDILRLQREIDEFDEAIRVLNLAKSVENV